MLQKAVAVSLALLVLAVPTPQEVIPGGDIFKLLMNGGVAAILVYIWWSTHKQANKEHKQLRQTIGEAFRATRQNSREVARQNQQRHAQRADKLMDLMNERAKLDRQLTGVLNRLETRIESLDDE